MKEAGPDRLFGWKTHLWPFAVGAQGRAVFAYQRQCSAAVFNPLPSSWASNKRAAFSSTPKPKTLPGAVVDMPSERLLVILAIGRGAVISTGPDIQEIPIGLLLESDPKFPLAQKAINCPAWGMGLSNLGSP